MSPIAVEGVAAGILLVWYKSSGALFPPNAVLAGNLFATAGAAATSVGGPAASVVAGAKFLVFPWLAGHGLLYGAALALAPVRGAARVALTQGRLRSLEGAR